MGDRGIERQMGQGGRRTESKIVTEKVEERLDGHGVGKKTDGQGNSRSKIQMIWSSVSNPDPHSDPGLIKIQ